MIEAVPPLPHISPWRAQGQLCVLSLQIFVLRTLNLRLQEYET
jgi:hypothetical protein